MKHTFVIFLVMLFVTTIFGLAMAQGTTKNDGNSTPSVSVRSLNSDEELAEIRARKEALHNVESLRSVTHIRTRGPHWDMPVEVQQENSIDSKRTELIDKLNKTATTGTPSVQRATEMRALRDAINALNSNTASSGSGSTASSTRASSSTNINSAPRQVFDVTTGQPMTPAAGGVIDPRTGTFHQDVGGGYVNTRTGEFSPKIDP
jgi:hypothetical protein